jgi:hypothetical protein
MKAAGTSAPKTHDLGDDTESLSDLGEEDIRVEHDRYFGKLGTQGESGLPVSLELLTDNETDTTTKDIDDGRRAELDDDDQQIFWDEDAGGVVVGGDENALGEVRLDSIYCRENCSVFVCTCI